jgi:hypothetical protein
VFFQASTPTNAADAIATALLNHRVSLHAIEATMIRRRWYAPSLGEDVGPRRRPLRELHGRRAAALDRVEDVAPPPLSQKRYQKCKRRPERNWKNAQRPAS